MNPYETDVRKVPESDVYADLPLYGRYSPHPTDFTPDPNRSQDDVEYWKSVIGKCSEKNRVLSIPGRRETFAIGSVIVQSSHLQYPRHYPTVNYRMRDQNEVAALSIMRENFPKIPVPHVYYQGEIGGYAVLIQERIPGVALNVAWPYLTSRQKASYRKQARAIVEALSSYSDPKRYPLPSYVWPDSQPGRNREIGREEYQVLFKKRNAMYGAPTFAHNNMMESNVIVSKGRIAGIIGWEMAGFFGKDRAMFVHRQVRKPPLESHVAMGLDRHKRAELMYWSEL